MTSAFEMASRHLYLCTSGRDDLLSFVSGCIEGGVDVVQLRDKDEPAKRVVELAKQVSGICRDHDVPFILNDRPDLALDSGADGVHLGQEDVSVTLARRLLGADAIIGLSTHAPEEVRASVDEPVDYVSAGPVIPTPTKPGRAATGIDYLRMAVAEARRPVFVTGGVSPGAIPELAAAGAQHFVVVRYLTEADDPRRAARQLRDAIDRVVRAH